MKGEPGGILDRLRRKGNLAEEDLEQLKELFLAEEREGRLREEELCRLKDRELLDLEEQLKQAHRKEQFINEIGQQLTASLDLEAIIATFHRTVGTRVAVDRILLAFHEARDDSLVYRYFEENTRSAEIPETISLSATHRLVADCVRTGKMIHREELHGSDDCFLACRGGSMVLTPLKLEGCVRGVLVIHCDRPRAYSREDREFLASLAPFLSIALFNARHHEELEVLNKTLLQERQELMAAYAQITRMANYDSLTDLPNLRLLNEFLPRYMEQAKRQGWILGVIFIDLDDFKPVNDSLGHDAGDRVLTETARRILQALRRSDIVARVGGDEFIALVQGARDRKDVEAIAVKILDALREPCVLEEGTRTVGASLGISLYPQDGVTAEELKARADRAMYRVKGLSKAGYAFYSDGDDGGESADGYGPPGDPS